MSPEYYERADRLLPRFLVEMHEAICWTHGEVTADTILAWCDAHYPDRPNDPVSCRGFFTYLRDEITAALAQQHGRSPLTAPQES